MQTQAHISPAHEGEQHHTRAHYGPTPRAILTKAPRSGSLTTSSPRKTVPFITIYTPLPAVCAVAKAIPRLKAASLSANRDGASAPVRTMVFPAIPDNALAVRVIVSVP